VHDVVRVPEEAEQRLGAEVGLHARGVVVDAERQVHRVGHLEEVRLDVRLRAAHVRRRREDGSVGAVRLGEADVLDRRARVVPGAAVEERHAVRLHRRGADDDLLALGLGEHRHLARRAHDQHGARAVLALELEQRAERAVVRPAAVVERRDQRDERAFDACAGHEYRRA
jgi:hypothetical protein